MPNRPQPWESATPHFGIRYPKPTVPVRKLAEALEHMAIDIEAALLDHGKHPGPHKGKE